MKTGLSREASLFSSVAWSGAGAALLMVPALRWRIDGAARAAPPTVLTDLLCAGTYALALALLTIGWRATTRRPWSPRAVLGWGLVVHLIALAAPPFLSLDPLCYAAIGRATAWFHHGPYQPLVDSLPPGDPFLARLPWKWQHEGSAYWPAFNAVAWLVARIAHDSLWVHLRAFQLVGLACSLGTAWLTAIAVGTRLPRQAGRAAALVLFCPVTVIEATVNAHNDAMLALSVAAFAVAVTRGRRGASLGWLLAGLLVKASGLLMVAMRAAQLGLDRVRRHVTLPRVLIGGLACIAVAIGGTIVAARYFPILRLVTSLIGTPDALPHCTRSIECIPRAALFWVSHRALAAWLVGIAFRAAGGLWLFYVAWRAHLDGERRVLAWAATGLFFYYLLLHAFMQSWYLLSLVPLIPHADARVAPAIRLFAVAALAYYAVRLPLDGDLRPSIVATKELLEGFIVVLPPLLLLLRERAARRVQREMVRLVA